MVLTTSEAECTASEINAVLFPKIPAIALNIDKNIFKIILNKETLSPNLKLLDGLSIKIPPSGDNMNLDLPKNVSWIIKKIEENNKKAYAVGGCVRDSLLGNNPKDWDITTNALPCELIEIFKDYKLIEVGREHGTIGVIIDKEVYEITTFRLESTYTDKRHPDKVEFSNAISADLRRRDFTINAMAYNDKDGLIDLYGGIEDLKNKTLRCVGNPELRFKEDALRILRCLRFSSVLNFEIEKETSNAIKQLYKNLQYISAERINSEINQMFSINCKRVLDDYNIVFEFIIPNWNIDKKIKEFSDNLYINYALIYNDGEKAYSSLKSLKQSNQIIKSVCFILENVSFVEDFNIYKAKLLLKRGEIDNFKNTVLYYCIKNNKKEKLEEYLSYAYKILKENMCYKLSQLAINGNDIAKSGHYESREIKFVLEHIYTKVIFEKLNNDKVEIMKYINTEGKRIIDNLWNE